MLSRPVTSRIGAVLAVGVALLATAIPASAAVAPSAASCTSTNGTTGTTSIESGEYIIQDNEWNSSAEQCVTPSTGTGWSVTTANFNLPTNGAPATYPSIYKGCHWGLCTTTNSMMPIQVSDLGTATTSWSTTQPATGAYDVAYDIWFNSTPTTPGQPDGTELMIWLNSRGGVQPFGSQTGTANLDGMAWNVWQGQQTSWKIISYVLNPGGTSFTNLDVKSLIEDAVARGSLNPAHYLIDAEAGFEIWQGGQGLGTNSFQFSATPAGATQTDTQAPTAPSGVRVTSTTSTSAALAWTAATDNVGVTGYRIFRNGTQVGTTQGTTFTDTALTPGTQYSYTVKAIDAAGNLSAASTAATATTASGAQPPPPATGGCTATYDITSQWATGFTANVTVTAQQPTTGWQVGWTFPGQEQVTSMWNATDTQTGEQERAVNMSFNGTLAASQSTSFGFQASDNGTTAPPALTCQAS